MIDWRVTILVAGTFCVGLAELSLIGLLSEMAQDLGRPMADMGLVVSAYSVSFALGPPILLHFCSGIGTRRIALGSLFGVAAGCFLASQAETLWALGSIRAATAASGGVFVAVAVTMAVNLASPSRHGFVIGAILMGFSGALVLGVPLGMAMAASYGWRSVFMLISAVCMAVTMLLPAIPETPRKRSTRSRAVLDVVSGGAATLHVFAITLLWITGYSVLFTFLVPFLHSRYTLGPDQSSLLLLAFGLATILGSGAGGMLVDRFGHGPVLTAGLAAHALVLGASVLLAATFPAAVGFVLAWGLSAWVTTPALQARLVAIDPEQAELRLSLNNSVLHLGIALGAWIGSIVIRGQPEDLAVAAAVMVASGCGIAALGRHRGILAPRHGEHSG